MDRVDVFRIIQRYIPPDSLTYAIYVPHVTCVTAKALRIARCLGLSKAQRQFIEQAALLHDIGIVRVRAEEIGCAGDLPYIAHIVEGRKILDQEGLPRHALVAERHVGVGILATEVVAENLPLPPRDYVPESIEEQIISWADLFFSKHPGKLWYEKSVKKVRRRVKKFGDRHIQVFDSWHTQFKCK